MRCPGAGRGIRPRRRDALTVLLSAGAVALAAIGLSTLGAFGSLEQSTVDARFSLRGADRPSDLVVVGIDEHSFSVLRHQWPFPRSFHARMIARLHAAGARAIVYDIQFTEPTAQDLALYDAIGRAGGAVLATSATDGHGHTDVLGGDANLIAVHAEAAAANLTNLTDDSITRYPYAVGGLRSIGVVMAQRLTHRSPDPAQYGSGGALIDYRGPPGTIRTVSYSDVLLGHVAPSVFRNKIVVVGATAATLQDLHATPVGGSALMSGPEVQANAIWTALHGNPLRTGPGWLGLLITIVCAALAPMLALRLGPVAVTSLVLAAVAIYLAATQAVFDLGTVLPIVQPVVAAMLGVVVCLIARLTSESSRRRLLEWMVGQRVHQLRESQLELVYRLAAAAESRDEDTGQHLSRIGTHCYQLALAVGMDQAEAEMLRHACAMHDIGKIAIPDRILLKPGKLDESEWEIMRSHTTRGAELLAGSASPLLQLAEVIALTHHERWDGTGYPNGLAGTEIPLAGRICAVCDMFDALCHARPYKHAWPRQLAIDEIRRVAGTHLDPELAAAFVHIITEAEVAEPQKHTAIGALALPALEPERGNRIGAASS